MGLQVFITEMDVNDRKLPDSVPERDIRSGEDLSRLPDMMLAEPNVNTVLTWGITDRYNVAERAGACVACRTAYRSGRCPSTTDYSPTPAFFAERDAIDSRRTGAQPGGDPYAPFNTGAGQSAQPSTSEARRLSPQPTHP